MKVQGSDCSIVIKTTSQEMGIPYSDETIRQAVSILQEEAPIEGNGISKAIRKNNGVTGCIVTPLTIGTAPLLLYLVMGNSGKPIFVSETRNLYRHTLDLQPLEDGPRFDLVQERGDGKRLYEGCGVEGFELRINREETIKLKLNITGECPPVSYPNNEKNPIENSERFNGNDVTYKINNKEYKNIYGLTLETQKTGGTKTELWIKRGLETGPDIPSLIDELTFTAQLLKDKYEYRHFGLFRFTITRLIQISDETEINAPDTVIGSLRYYIAGTVKAEVFTNEE